MIDETNSFEAKRKDRCGGIGCVNSIIFFILLLLMKDNKGKNNFSCTFFLHVFII